MDSFLSYRIRAWAKRPRCGHERCSDPSATADTLAGAPDRRPLRCPLLRPSERRAAGVDAPADAEGRRVRLVHADAGGYKPLNWMTPPTVIEDHGDALVVRKRAGKTRGPPRDPPGRGAERREPRDGGGRGARERRRRGDLQELLAARPEVLAEALRLVSREWPTDIGPVDLMCRDADGGWVAVEIKRVGTIDAVEQLAAISSESASTRRSPSAARPRGATLQPQATVLAEARGLDCAGSTLPSAATSASPTSRFSRSALLLRSL